MLWLASPKSHNSAMAVGSDAAKMKLRQARFPKGGLLEQCRESETARCVRLTVG